MRSRTPAPMIAALGAAEREPALQDALNEPARTPWRLRTRLLGLAGLVALLAYPFVLNAPFPQHVMIMIFLYALMAQSWNILAGYCGQISLGHAVFFGIGAYSSGFLFATFRVSPWLGMMVGIAIAMAAAVAIGLPTLRLRGHYFAIATLVIAESVQIVFQRWEFVGAASGIWLPIVRENPLLNFQFNESKIPYYFIALGFLSLVCLAVWYLERSKAGYYFRAIREDPEAASSLGVDVSRYKVLAFMISAGFMSIAGTFYAQYVLVVDPETVFPLTLSILVLLIAVMGGVGTLWGPIIGAAVLVPLSEFTRIYLGGTGGSVDLIIYGALIVLICVFRPVGLLGIWKDWRLGTAVGGAKNRGNA
ncbi:MAG: branched-chain amino acid ABC transporter permease [Acidiferrobacterales bacterium]